LFRVPSDQDIVRFQISMYDLHLRETMYGLQDFPEQLLQQVQVQSDALVEFQPVDPIDPHVLIKFPFDLEHALTQRLAS